MMNPSPVRSNKRRGRRHERIGEGLVRRRRLHRAAESIELTVNAAAGEEPF
jgi:hypothetical protein